MHNIYRDQTSKQDRGILGDITLFGVKSSDIQLPPPQKSQISINDSIEFFVDFDEKNDTADVETKEELKERREQEQTILEEKLIKIDRLSNKEFLVRSGQVGIQYNRIGSLLVFGDEFLMMLKFKFPFKDFKLIKMVGKGSCFTNYSIGLNLRDSLWRYRENTETLHLPFLLIIKVCTTRYHSLATA